MHISPVLVSSRLLIRSIAFLIVTGAVVTFLYSVVADYPGQSHVYLCSDHSGGFIERYERGSVYPSELIEIRATEDGWQFYGRKTFKDTEGAWRELAAMRLADAGSSVMLKRISKPRWRQWWRWWEFLTHPRWRLPVDESAEGMALERGCLYTFKEAH